MARLLNILSLAVFCCAYSTDGLQATDSCDDVVRFYHHQQFGLLSKPVLAENLNVCDRGYSCCSPAAEDKLSVISMTHIQNGVTRERQHLAGELSDRYNKYNAYFEKLIDTAKNSLDKRFVDTYGSLYEINKIVFMELFDDLKRYYEGSNLDLTEIFDDFFTILMQKIFKLLHPDYIIDNKYMQCVANNLNVINPFADIPQKVTNQVQRSLIAARTLVQALKTGQRVIEDLEGVYLTTACVKDFMKMFHCSKCSGHVEILPCSNTCNSILSECLTLLGEGEFNSAWRKYMERMMAVVGRLEGSFDIEYVLYPIDVKLSEAIMMLQDNEDSILVAVTRQCGELMKNPNATANPFGFGFFDFGFKMPEVDEGNDDMDLDSWSNGKDLLGGFENFNLDGLDFSSQSDLGRTKRSAVSEPKRKRHKRRKSKRGRRRKSRHRVRDITPSAVNSQYGSMNVYTDGVGVRLRTLLNEMHENQESLKRFWKNLPKTFCDKNAEREPMKNCWNGHKVTKNIPEMEEDLVLSRNANKTFPDANMKRQIMILHEMSAKLASAYRGVDPAFVDGEIIGMETFSGDGSGENESRDFKIPDSNADEDGREILMKHLEKSEIDLIEKALNRSVDKKAKFSDIKHILRKHPLVIQGDNEVTNTENFGKLSDRQLKQLKKMLDIPEERPQDHSEKPIIRATMPPKPAGTTSGTFSNRLFSLPLLTFALFLQWVKVKNVMV